MQVWPDSMKCTRELFQLIRRRAIGRSDDIAVIVDRGGDLEFPLDLSVIAFKHTVESDTTVGLTRGHLNDIAAQRHR